jgi:hypothetical protein
MLNYTAVFSPSAMDYKAIDVCVGDKQHNFRDSTDAILRPVLSAPLASCLDMLQSNGWVNVFPAVVQPLTNYPK